MGDEGKADAPARGARRRATCRRDPEGNSLTLFNPAVEGQLEAGRKFMHDYCDTFKVLERRATRRSGSTRACCFCCAWRTLHGSVARAACGLAGLRIDPCRAQARVRRLLRTRSTGSRALFRPRAESRLGRRRLNFDSRRGGPQSHVEGNSGYTRRRRNIRHDRRCRAGCGRS